MFYHVLIRMRSVLWLEQNLTRQQALGEWLCPFSRRAVTVSEGPLHGPPTAFNFTVYKSERAIDPDWPVPKGSEAGLGNYDRALLGALPTHAEDVTLDLAREALALVEAEKWKHRMGAVSDKLTGLYCLFLGRLDKPEIERNYRCVIQPAAVHRGFEIESADEIASSTPSSEGVLSRISLARFVVADVTDAQPSCYYQLGYADALGKPVILLAKQGSEQPPGLFSHQWHYWLSDQDLQPVFARALASLLAALGLAVVASQPK